MKLFLTDYASYNNGTQFEFGHWVDLNDFSDASEFFEYIGKHFKDCDAKSPLDEFGSKREEIMFTDFEGFPRSLYGETMSEEEVQKIYAYTEEFEDYSGSDWLQLHSEYCSENSIENDIFDFSDPEEFFETFFSGRTEEAVRAAIFGDVNWGDNYIKFNGYGNLETITDPMHEIDEEELIEWKLTQLV